MSDHGSGGADVGSQSPVQGDLSATGSIPGYEITRVIGEGGMGEVYEAIEEGPLDRVVAIKVLKLGMDTKDFLARFASERQALGIMDHPCIPRVFAAGATAQGRPYFVMEYVPGIHITTYCDRHRLDVERRLRLVIQVCAGVQHAHQKGIIHRDLKASNILVGKQDDRPNPKIIDFGIAKAVAPDPTELTSAIGHTEVLGTLEYMSPEQVASRELDIDTRTDVYALGVLLYELLTGVLPFDPSELRAGGIDSARQRIVEEDPALPSHRAVKGGRSTLRGDLDAIVMRSLAKDRTDRYASPSELAADIERYLRHEPVVARAPGVGYQARKFIRRNRAGVFAASLVFLSSILGAVAATGGLVRARGEERAATEQAQIATGVSDFLVGLFQGTADGLADPNTITAREILDRGYERIGSELRGQPEIQSRLRHTIGTVYASLGLNVDAASVLEEARAERRARMGPNDPLVAESAWALGQVLVVNGDYSRAEELVLEALGSRRRIFGEQSAEVAEALLGLATVQLYQGRYSEGEATALESLQATRTLPVVDNLALSRGLSRLSTLFLGPARYREAVTVLDEALDLQRTSLPSMHPDIGDTMALLGLSLALLGSYERADSVSREAILVNAQVLGEDHFVVGLALAIRADLMLFTGRLEEAEGFYERALDNLLAAVGADHFYYGQGLVGYSALLLEQGRLIESEQAAREVLAIFATRLPSDHYEVAQVETTLGTVLGRLGRVTEAEELLLRSYRTLSSGQGGSRWTKLALLRLIELYDGLGRAQDALTYRQLLDAARAER